MRKARTLLLTSLSLSFSSIGFADWQTESFVGLTADLYKDEAQTGQCCDTLANRALIAPRLLWWNDSGWAATFSPYAEYEFQSKQGFINLREANITYAGETIEWLLGYGVVYWGVTEVYQPVNVVNQYDGRIALGYEEKMGQPMLQARWLPDWGDVQMLLLPFHQPRKFREPDQRRTLIKPVDDDAIYSDGENSLDSAIRIGFWQDALDVGISAFTAIAENLCSSNVLMTGKPHTHEYSSSAPSYSGHKTTSYSNGKGRLNLGKAVTTLP